MPEPLPVTSIFIIAKEQTLSCSKNYRAGQRKSDYLASHPDWIHWILLLVDCWADSMGAK
jgi:hypothetical protein